MRRADRLDRKPYAEESARNNRFLLRYGKSPTRGGRSKRTKRTSDAERDIPAALQPTAWNVPPQVNVATVASVTQETDANRIYWLPCWHGTLKVAPLAGGMTNRNYLVEDSRGKHVVRLGEDVPHHHLLRWHELAVSRAAHAAGLSPEVEYAEPGVLVMRFLEARTLTSEEVRDPSRLPAIVDLLKRCHRELPLHLHGPTLTFWPFQVVRSYAVELRAQRSSWAHRLNEFLSLNGELERHLTRAPFAFGHNDLLAGNVLDDGRRLWLIDWDYAGYSTPLFDLANLATNNGMNGALEITLLEAYFEEEIDDSLFRAYRAMRVVSLLRETMWGMVSELYPAKEFDYATYTRENLARLEEEIARYRAG